MREITNRASLPARRLQWNPETLRRLAELLLEGNPLNQAIDLLGVEFGRVERQEAVCLVLDAGGIYPFIYEQVPTLSREDVLRMQGLYHRHDGGKKNLSRFAAEKDKKRSALSHLASHDIYDEGVEERFERLLGVIRQDGGIVPHTFVIRGMSLLREALYTERAGTLVSCLTIRTESPSGRGTTAKRKETHALFVARLMREIIGLRTNPISAFGRAVSSGNFRKVVLQVMEHAKGREYGFVAVESVFLDIVLRLD